MQAYMERTIFKMRQKVSHQVLKVLISLHHDSEGQGGARRQPDIEGRGNAVINFYNRKWQLIEKKSLKK